MGSVPKNQRLSERNLRMDAVMIIMQEVWK